MGWRANPFSKPGIITCILLFNSPSIFLRHVLVFVSYAVRNESQESLRRTPDYIASDRQ
jgi:hypothetical protein